MKESLILKDQRKARTGALALMTALVMTLTGGTGAAEEAAGAVPDPVAQCQAAV